jgi:hypothetical protein
VRKITSSRPNKLVVRNENGAIAGQPEAAAAIVAKHFASLFSKISLDFSFVCMLEKKILILYNHTRKKKFQRK